MKKTKIILLIASSLTLSACLGPNQENSQTTTSSPQTITTATQPNTTTISTTAMTTTTTSQVTSSQGTTTPEPKEEIAAMYSANQEIVKDSVGDGLDEKILYSNRDLIINDVSYFNVAENDLDPGNSPITDEFMIVNLDQNNKNSQILLNIDGPSGDPEGFFYQYSEAGLKRLGSVPTAIESLEEQFDGQGKITGLMALCRYFRLGLHQQSGN